MAKLPLRQRAPRPSKRARTPRSALRKRAKKAPRPKGAKPKYDARLEMGLKSMRLGDSLAAAARSVNVSPKRLRRYITAMGVVERRNEKWTFKRDRRFRRMPIYSDGERIVVTVPDLNAARLIGEYMGAVRRFFETEDIDLLAKFRGQSVRDVSRKRFVLETRPNTLFRLDASGVEPFELVYAIVKPE